MRKKKKKGGSRVESKVERRRGEHRADARRRFAQLCTLSRRCAVTQEVRMNVLRRAYEEEEEELPQRDPPCSRERRGVGDGHAAGGPAQSPSLPPVFLRGLGAPDSTSPPPQRWTFLSLSLISISSLLFFQPPLLVMCQSLHLAVSAPLTGTN